MHQQSICCRYHLHGSTRCSSMLGLIPWSVSRKARPVLQAHLCRPCACVAGVSCQFLATSSQVLGSQSWLHADRTTVETTQQEGTSGWRRKFHRCRDAESGEQAIAVHQQAAVSRHATYCTAYAYCCRCSSHSRPQQASAWLVPARCSVQIDRVMQQTAVMRQTTVAPAQQLSPSHLTPAGALPP
jgi:hypothetical protein